MTTLYKFTNGNRPTYGEGTYPILKDGRTLSSRWLPVRTPVLCESGWHATTAAYLPHHLGADLYEVEVRGAAVYSPEKSAHAQLRFLRRIPEWTPAVAAEFARDAADAADYAAAERCAAAARAAARAAADAADYTAAHAQLRFLRRIPEWTPAVAAEFARDAADYTAAERCAAAARDAADYTAAERCAAAARAAARAAADAADAAAPARRAERQRQARGLCDRLGLTYPTA